MSKGGSGDVLSGLIGSLLAQGWDSLHATITASLAHAIAGQNYSQNNYSLIPSDLIEEIKKLWICKSKIKELHSYDLPEIIQLDITNTSEEYLKFIGENTIWVIF